MTKPGDNGMERQSAAPGAAAGTGKPEKRPWRLLPEVWGLLRPRRGLLALGFGLMLVNRVAGFVLPGSTKFLIDNVVTKREIWLLGPLVLAVLGATLVQGLTSFALTQLLSKSAQRMIADMRTRVQAHVGRLSVRYYDANKTGALISRIMSDVEGVRNLLGTGLVDFAGSVVTAGIAGVILLKMSVSMTLVAGAILGIFGSGLKYAFRTIRPIYRARPKINAEVTGRLNESLSGVRVVKGYHAEEREEAVFRGGVQRLLDNVLKTLTATSLMGLGATTLAGIVTALIIWMGVHRIHPGGMTLGDLMTYTIFLGMLVAPVSQIVSLGPQITEALAGLERTREVLNEKPEDEDAGRTATLGRVEGRVEFENVNFAYDPNKPVLFEVNFLAAPGTATALVGPSGSGKSTMIGLVAAFYTPTSGRVLVDGVDLATVRLDSYRSQLGVVLQEMFLFDGSIRENVAFGRPAATEEEILAACRVARVDEFAEKFAEGYGTIVGERGVKLSGGQKQRVSIARAILANPRILILDEATSSLDSESEALIQEGLRYLMQGRTTFVIAHRLSTIRRADQILVIESGRVIERGTHESLYAARGRYYDLYTKQHGVESNLFLAPGETSEAEESKEANVAEEPLSRDGGANGDASVIPQAVRLLRNRER